MNDLETDNKFLKKSALFNVLGTVFKISGPLLTVLLARTFGATEFGIFVATQALLLTIARSATLGLDKGLHWYLPQNKLRKRSAYEGIMESFWITIFISIVATIIIFIGSWASFFSKEIPYYAVSLVFYSGTYILSNSSEGNRKPWNAILINDFLVAVLSPLVSIILFFLNVPHSLPLGLLFGQVGGFLMHSVAVRRQFKSMPIFPGKRVTKELLYYSVPIGLTVLVGNVLMRSTLWMVLFFLGAEAAGVYALMITISNGLQTIRNGFNPILIPVVSQMDEERLKTDIKPIFSYCISMATLIQIVIGFFIVLFPEEIMSIAGKNFVVQPKALGILSLALSLTFGILLIPSYGLFGAALSMLIPGIISSGYSNIYLFKRNLRLYSSKLWVELLWITALLTLYVVLNAQNIHLEMAQKIALYVGVLFVLGMQFLFYKRKF